MLIYLVVKLIAILGDVFLQHVITITCCKYYFHTDCVKLVKILINN